MSAFRITYNPGQDRSMTKAQWKKAYGYARTCARVMSNFGRVIDVYIEVQFTNLLLYGTARTVIHG